MKTKTEMLEVIKQAMQESEDFLWCVYEPYQLVEMSLNKLKTLNKKELEEYYLIGDKILQEINEVKL